MSTNIEGVTQLLKSLTSSIEFLNTKCNCVFVFSFLLEMFIIALDLFEMAEDHKTKENIELQTMLAMESERLKSVALELFRK